MYEKVSIQSCEGGSMDRKDDYDRLGSKALYAFIYPNFMINRYLLQLLEVAMAHLFVTSMNCFS